MLRQSSQKTQDLIRRFWFMPLAIGLLSIIVISIMAGKQKEAGAFGGFCPPARGCDPLDRILAPAYWDMIEDAIWDNIILGNIRDHLNEEENWIVREFFSEFWQPGIEELMEFLAASGMYQVQIIGTFFDAKNQLETQRLFFKLHAQAHKDYHPSESFCAFGTGARSLAATESRSRLNVLALSDKSIRRQLSDRSFSSGRDDGADKDARWEQFVSVYCDPRDNDWDGSRQGLDLACDRDGLGLGTDAGAVDQARVNMDVDYTRLIEEPRTLDVDFSNVATVAGVTTGVLSDDEEDVMAMASNLYGHDIPGRGLKVDKEGGQSLYMSLRSVVAKRAVAEHSFHSIVALKSRGTNGVTGTPANTGRYLASVIKDLMPSGTPDSEIYEIIGTNPSYYGQLEILAKKIYQNPDFFANLYDKPANVQRKSVAMKAINVMLDRALYESELRQEMLMSVMLASSLNRKFRNINSALIKNKK